VNAVGPGIADANLEYGVTAATYPNLLSVTTYLSAYPQNTYVTTGFNVTDSTGSTTYETGTYNVPVSIVGYQVVPTPTPAPTPASNLNGQINQAVANVRCKVGSGFAGDGCAIAVNQIFSAALGHTIPRVEGGVKGDSPVPGSETCYSNPHDGGHPCHLEWVPDVVELMVRDGFAVQIVPPNALLQGDIAVQDGTDPINGMNHIGFCDNAGCSQTISNADSIGQLCGVSNASYSSQGYVWSPNLQPTFYRIVKK
jgi:hypothetical protein